MKDYLQLVWWLPPDSKEIQLLKNEAAVLFGSETSTYTDPDGHHVEITICIPMPSDSALAYYTAIDNWLAANLGTWHAMQADWQPRGLSSAFFRSSLRSSPELVTYLKANRTSAFLPLLSRKNDRPGWWDAFISPA